MGRRKRWKEHQGLDTITVFVRNSEGCEDTHQPVRGGCQYRGTRSKRNPCPKNPRNLSGPNKVRKSDYYLVVREGYPLKKDYTWEPIENLCDQEEMVESFILIDVSQ
jgi:hypothetical protein